MAWRRQATSHYLNQCWMLLIGPLGTNVSEILIEMDPFSFMKMHLKCRLEIAAILSRHQCVNTCDFYSCSSCQGPVF